MNAVARLTWTGLRRRGVAQVLVLGLVAALAAAAIVAGLAAQRSSADLVDAAYERANRPDLALSGPLESLREVADDEAVAEASEPTPIVGAGTVEVDGDGVELLLAAVDPEALPAVGPPELVDGRWPAPGADEEVVVEQSLVADGVVEIGEQLTVEREGGEEPVTLVVVGSAIDLTDCFWPTCDPLRAFGSADLVASFRGDGDPLHLAAYRLVDADGAEAAHARLVSDPDLGLGGNAWPDTRDDILVIGGVFSALLGGFGVFLLATACLVVAGATAARMVARRRALGLLQAVGFRPGQLAASVLVEHLLIGAVGVVAGWVLGSLLAPLVQPGVDGVVGDAGAGFAVGPLVVALVLVEAFLAASVLVPAWRAGRQSPAAVLRDAPPAPGGGRLAAGVARALGASASTVCGVRRAFARPLRAALAGGAIVVAATGAIVAAGFLHSIDEALDRPAATGDPWGVSIRATGATDAAVERALDDEPAVASWYTERDARGMVDGQVFGVRVLGGDPEAAAFEMAEGRRIAGPDEAIAGYGFLQATGLDLGDRARIEVDGQPIEVTIVGWYHEFEDTGEILRVREEAVSPPPDAEPGWWLATPADGTSNEQLAASLGDRLGDGAHAEAITMNDGGLGAINGALTAVAAILGIVAFANLVAVTLSGTRERARSLGVLRTIGTTTRQLIGQSAIGAGAVGLVAGVVGVPVGSWVFRALSDGITSGVGIGPGLTVGPSTAFLVAVVPLSALVAAAAGALAAAGVARRPAVELVRYE